ncbi:MAG TPA: glycerol-3-phosphate ABC transporter ATP-binding protein [Elusimicrobia bacterium]|nr:glycerol-3-phosphate ABC transporter ATP-binding protein [Elusimicrobiota bacterium]
MAKVVLEKVEKRYAGNAAATVRALDLEIDDGEFLVLVGSSGCGKSTVLRMIAGLIDVTGGRIFIDGADVTRRPPKDRDVSMVFQNYALFPHMDVSDNIGFGLKIRGCGKEETAQRVAATAELLGIGALLDKKPGQLSGGQRQRVALGRAIIRNPKVFLFDEPLSNLDAKLRAQMRAELLKLHRRLKATTIYVTHDQCEAMTMADRLAVLNEGALQQCGAPLEVYAEPKNTFVATFIGMPPMNLFKAELAAEDGACRFRLPGGALIPVPEPLARRLKARKDTGYTVGIRPEHIVPARERRAGPAIACEVELAESLGNGLCLHCLGAGLSFQAALKPDFPVKTGDRIELAFSTEKLCVFDGSGDAVAGAAGD